MEIASLGEALPLPLELGTQGVGLHKEQRPIRSGGQNAAWRFGQELWFPFVVCLVRKKMPFPYA